MLCVSCFLSQVTDAKAARDRAKKLEQDLRRATSHEQQRELQAKVDRAWARADTLRLSESQSSNRRRKQLCSQIGIELASSLRHVPWLIDDRGRHVGAPHAHTHRFGNTSRFVSRLGDAQGKSPAGAAHSRMAPSWVRRTLHRLGRQQLPVLTLKSKGVGHLE